MPNNTVFNGVLFGDVENPILAGVYHYTLHEGACMVTSGVVVSVNEPANPGLSTTYLICENYPPFLMTDFLSGNPDYGGVWFNSNNSPTSEIYDTNIQNTELFTYYIDTVEACTPVFSTLYVIENLLPNPGLPSEITICETAAPLDLFPLLDGNPDSSGVWFNEDFQNIPSPFDPSSNSAGVYTYMVAGDVPCPSSQNQLTINYTPGVYSGIENDTILCENSTVFNLFEQLSGVISPGGTWTDQNNQNVDSLITISLFSAGAYTYSVSLLGCSDQSSTVMLSVESLLTAGTDSTVILCETVEDYNLADALSSNVSSNGIWIQNNQIISPIYENVEIGFHEFTYQTNSQACPQDEATITLQVDQSMFAGNDSSIVLCQNNSDILLNNFLNNQSDDFGIWLFNNDTVSNTFSPINSLEGEYVYLLDSENSCPVSQATIDITVIDSIMFPNGIIIQDCNYQQEISIGEEEEINYTYQWTPEIFLSNSNSSNPTIDINTLTIPFNQIFTIEINNEACQQTIEREIIINEAPVIISDTIFSGCEGEVIALTAGDFNSVLWSPQNLFANPENANQNINLTTTNSINLSVTNEYNCTSDKDIEIIVHPTPTVSFEINNQIHCTPAIVEITNTSYNVIPTEYFWSFSNGYQSNEQVITQYFDSPVSFNFSILAISENGCSNSLNQEQDIHVFQTPNASFSYEENNLTIFNNQINLNNSSQFATEYLWTIDNQFFSTKDSPSLFLPQIAGHNNIICLQAINNGCTAESCQSIFISLEQNIYIPNTFTPNDDQLNDIFKPILLEDNILEYSFVIYNRWGEIVFETNDLSEGWIGDTKNNHAFYAKDGTYIWQLKIKEKDVPGEQNFSGKVTLIR